MAAKISKKDAGYGPGLPHCGLCTHFIEAEDDDDSKDACELVEGKIDEDDWCKLYKAKRQRTLAEGGGAST